MKRARFRPRLAIATGHKPDDDYTIPAAERKIRADYQMERGPLPGGQRSRAAGRAVFLVKVGRTVLPAAGYSQPQMWYPPWEDARTAMNGRWKT